MRKFLLLCLSCFALTAKATDPAHIINIDISKQDRPYLVDMHQAETALLRVYLYENGAKWQPTSTNGGTFAYGTNQEDSASMSMTTGAVSTTDNYIDFNFVATNLNTNGIFYSQIIITNNTGSTFVYSSGQLRLRKSPITTGATPASFSSTINADLYNWIGTITGGIIWHGTAIEQSYLNLTNWCSTNMLNAVSNEVDAIQTYTNLVLLATNNIQTQVDGLIAQTNSYAYLAKANIFTASNTIDNNLYVNRIFLNHGSNPYITGNGQEMKIELSQGAGPAIYFRESSNMLISSTKQIAIGQVGGTNCLVVSNSGFEVFCDLQSFGKATYTNKLYSLLTATETTQVVNKAYVDNASETNRTLSGNLYVDVAGDTMTAGAILNLNGGFITNGGHICSSNMTTLYLDSCTSAGTQLRANGGLMALQFGVGSSPAVIFGDGITFANGSTINGSGAYQTNMGSVHATNVNLTKATFADGTFQSSAANIFAASNNTFTGTNTFANILPGTSNSYSIGSVAFPWLDLYYDGSRSLTQQFNIVSSGITWASNGVVNVSNSVVAITNNIATITNNAVNGALLKASVVGAATNYYWDAQVWGVSMNYATATNGASFSNSIAWFYAPKAGTITNIIAESVEGICFGGLWVRSNGVPPTANSYIAYTNIPAVAQTSSNFAVNISYNAGVFIGVPVTNGNSTNVTFTIIGTE